MQNRLRRLALRPLLLSLLFAPQPARADAGAALDDYFRRLAAHGFSGSVLVARGPRVLLRQGYGFADRRRGIRNRPETAFDIASLDKQFLAAGILRLEEQGRLRVTDTLDRFFDGVPEDKRGITLHQVLSHTAGFPDEYWDEHETLSRAAFIQWVLRERPLVAPPGSRWAYASFDYWLIEEVIERVSGLPFEAYLRRELFAPARMPSTGFTLPHWRRDRVARATFWTLPDALLPGEWRFVDPLSRPPAWRILLSTVDDLHRWFLALRNGTVLAPESRRRLVTPVLSDYAYGWNVETTARGTRLIQHGGGGSGIGTVATFRWFVDEDLFVVILNNSWMPGFSADYLLADVEALLFGGSGTLPPPPAPRDPRAERRSVGSYRLPHGGTIELLRPPHGPLVARSLDPEGVAALRFGGTEGGHLPPDRLAAEVVAALGRGDFAPLEGSAEGDPAALRAWATAALEAVTQKRGPMRADAGAADDGKTGIATLHVRTFLYRGVPEVHTFLRVPFTRGEEYLRAIHFPSGKITLDGFAMPPAIEVVLAPAAGGSYTTWEPRLALSVRLRSDGRVLRLTGSDGSVEATRIAKEKP